MIPPSSGSVHIPSCKFKSQEDSILQGPLRRLDSAFACGPSFNILLFDRILLLYSGAYSRLQHTLRFGIAHTAIARAVDASAGPELTLGFILVPSPVTTLTAGPSSLS